MKQTATVLFCLNLDSINYTELLDFKHFNTLNIYYAIATQNYTSL